jgi:hypothetical protein
MHGFKDVRAGILALIFEDSPAFTKWGTDVFNECRMTVLSVHYADVRIM